MGEKYLDNNNTVMAHIARLREKIARTKPKTEFCQNCLGVGIPLSKRKGHFEQNNVRRRPIVPADYAAVFLGSQSVCCRTFLLYFLYGRFAFYSHGRKVITFTSFSNCSRDIPVWGVGVILIGWTLSPTVF